MIEQQPTYHSENIQMLETALLSHLLNNPDLYKLNMQLLNRDLFSKGSKCEKIYEAFESVIKRGETPDFVNISSEKNIEIETIIEYFNAVDYRFEFRSTLQRIIENRIKNNLINYAGSLINNLSNNANVFTEITKLKEFIEKNELNPVKRISSISETVNNLIESIEKRKDGKITGIRSGITKLDEHTGGLQKSDLFVIAGETSQGKTSLALTIAYNAAINQSARIAIFSLEMSTQQLTARLTSIETKISSKHILFYPLNKYDIERVQNMQHLPASEIYIDDCNNSSIDYIVSGIRQANMQFNIQVAIVDYLQLIKDSSKRNEETEISSNTRRLKNLAKELDITIILLSQLARDKSNPHPSISRLRGSGQIEEAADIVGLIWRPETSGGTGFVYPNHPHVDALGTAEFIIAKGRNYGIGSMILQYDKSLTYFSNYNELG